MSSVALCFSWIISAIKTSGCEISVAALIGLRPILWLWLVPVGREDDVPNDRRPRGRWCTGWGVTSPLCLGHGEGAVILKRVIYCWLKCNDCWLVNVCNLCVQHTHFACVMLCPWTVQFCGIPDVESQLTCRLSCLHSVLYCHVVGAAVTIFVPGIRRVNRQLSMRRLASFANSCQPHCSCWSSAHGFETFLSALNPQFHYQNHSMIRVLSRVVARRWSDCSSSNKLC